MIEGPSLGLQKKQMTVRWGDSEQLSYKDDNLVLSDGLEALERAPGFKLL